MKKFCSKCGNQLDLSKRTCNNCSAFNPFFIAGFANTVGNGPGSDIIIDEPVKQKEYAAGIESLRQEQLEQQKSDVALKNELLKVKEEAEKYKKETLELVTEVKKELSDIEKENKLLKEKVELLNNSTSNQQIERPVSMPQVTDSKTESKRGVTVLLACVLFVAVTGASYLFFNSAGKKTVANTTTVPPTVTKPAVIVEEKKVQAPEPVIKDTIPDKKLLAMAIVAPAAKATPSIAAPAAPIAVKKASTDAFALTESKLKGDLVGKKLSGCDITINSGAEIKGISNIALVDKLSATYLKYKCVVKIKQGDAVYTSSPYIYYSADGAFIKIDGTNCE